jgi:predicted ATP-grasp superfamily ATP-dependent carboligase
MKHPLENGHIKHGQKSKPLTISEQMNITQEVAGVVNVPQNKRANALDITASSFQKILGLSGTGENVLRLLKIT